MTTDENTPKDEWGHALLDAVARRGSGHTPDKKHPEYWDGSIKWISLQDSAQLDTLYIEDTAATITTEGIKNSSAVLHQKGTVVLSRDAGVGKSAIMAADMAVSQHFMAWTCGQRLNNHFLYYWLQSKKPEFERIANGNTIKTIGLPYFKELALPLPPLEEQKRIASALTDIDTLIGSLDQLIVKKRGIRQAAIHQLLTGERRLPGFSGKWQKILLDALAYSLKGSSLSKTDLSPDGTKKCILYGELFTTYGRVIHRVYGRTDSSNGTPSIAGDVLLPGSTTTTGIDLASASAVLEEGVLLGGDINIIRQRKRDSFNPAFLARYLTSVAAKDIAERAQGITIIHLYGRDLKSLLINLPPQEEQSAIAGILSDLDSELDALEAHRKKALHIKQGMMQELLTGRTRLV